jgi:CHASE1-domain containing sensor protein
VRSTGFFSFLRDIFRSTAKAPDDREKKRTWRPYVWASIATAVVGLALSVAAWLAVSVREDRLAELELSASADSHALILQDGIGDYMDTVGALRALFASQEDDVAREEFRGFTDFLLRGQTAILGASWIPRVTRADRAAHELAAVGEGLPGYHIKSIAADGSFGPPAVAFSLEA